MLTFVSVPRSASWRSHRNSKIANYSCLPSADRIRTIQRIGSAMSAINSKEALVFSGFLSEPSGTRTRDL